MSRYRSPDGRLRRARAVLAGGARLVRDVVPGADPTPGAGVAGHRRRPPHAHPRPHRQRQDAVGVPVGHRSAHLLAPAGRAHPPDPGALHLAAPGAGRRRGEEPAGSNPGHPPRRRPPRPRLPRTGGGVAHGRHAGRRAPPPRPPPARHPHHHARVAVPDAHLRGARDPARRRGRHRRRDPLGGPHQARFAPGPLTRAAGGVDRGQRRDPTPAHRPVGHPTTAGRDRRLPGWAVGGRGRQRATARGGR